MSLHKNIALTGFMGVGKSMVSNKLAILLKKKVVSTDQMVINRTGLSIAEIFEKYGEEHFRQLEADVVLNIVELPNLIIDCGGGVLLNPGNVAALRKYSKLIYLKASPECILDNLTKTDGLKDRPLLNTNNPLDQIQKLMAERQSFYEQADIMVDADFKTIDEIADSVMKEVHND